MRKSPAMILMAMLLPLISFASTIQVTNTNDSGPGSLRDAILMAASGDTVTFHASLANQTILLTSRQLVLDSTPGSYKKITILGLGADKLTIDGGGVLRHFYLYDEDSLILSGLTLANGGGHEHADSLAYHGGSIYAFYGAAVWATECVFTGNHSYTDTLSDVFGTQLYGGSGGAVYIYRGYGSFTDCKFMNNLCTGITYLNLTFTLYSPTYGGAVYERHSDVNFEQCLFKQNAAQYGGGLATLDSGAVSINECVFYNNEASSFTDSILTGSSFGNGGALYSSAGTGDNYCIHHIYRTKFLNNSAVKGGAIYNQAGTGTAYSFINIYNSIIADNTATLLTDYSSIGPGEGGGIYNYAGTGTAISRIVLWNSTVSGNRAIGGKGGAFFGESGTSAALEELYVHYSTITNNYSDTVSYDNNTYGGEAGGIYNSDGISSSMAFMLFQNSIIAGNHALLNADGTEFSSGMDTTLGYNIIGVADGFTLSPAAGDHFGTASAPTNPGLDTLQWYGGHTRVHPLLSGSLALNNGDPASTVAFDQRGEHRPVGGRVDIGSVEYQGSGGPCLVLADFDVPTDFCAGSALTFTSTSIGATNYEWHTRGLTVGLNLTLTYTYTEAGPATMMLIAVNGSCRDTMEKYFTLLPDIDDEVLVSTNGTFTNSEFLWLQDSCSTVLSTQNGACEYTWYRNGQLVGTNPTFTATMPGDYMLLLGNCCGDVDTMPLTIYNPDLELDLLGSGSFDTLVAVGSSITLNAGTFASYSWSTGATTASISATSPGSYSVTVTNANGCSNEQTVTLHDPNGIAGITAMQIQVYPNPATSAVMVSLAVTPSGVEGAAQTKFNLYNLTGQLVLEKPINQQQTNVELDLPEGVYIYKIFTDGQLLKTDKLVVVR